MTLHVHRGTSTDALADGLAALLSDPLDDPFAEEVVAAPAKGVERWLAQRLSHRLGASPGRGDGICAGVRFLTPHSLVALVLGVDIGDPWHPEQLAWPVLRAIDDSLGEPWAATLSTHLGHDDGAHSTASLDVIDRQLRRGRRYAVARRLAGLFAEYATQRPAMLADWRVGGQSNGVGTGFGDGLDGPVDDDLAWQPELWRRVLALVGGEGPDERHERVIDALRGGDLSGLELPGRLSLFGHTRIARGEVEVLGALAAHRDIHLWLPQASPAGWDRLAAQSAAGPCPRADDLSGLSVRHPLLASLGRDARELQRMLALADGTDHGVVETAGAAASTTTLASATLLALLQQDIAADEVPGAELASRVIPESDRSIQVHACHGASRQVEVLRDVIADLMQQDHTLEPRDILVMCPDVETWAPLIHAAFGLHGIIRDGGTGTDGTTDTTSGIHPAHTFRVRIADRAPLHTNPLLALADHLTLLAGGRLTASEVLDLARSAPVRRRFGFDDDDLERLSDWVDAVAIRWGLDADHRDLYRLRDVAQNTWRAGLDRILVGAAVDGEDLDRVGTALALDDLDSGDIERAGRIAELLARIEATTAAMESAGSAADWVAALRDGVLGLADVPLRDTWQVAAFEHELARMGAAAEAVGGTTLALSDVHALLDGRGSGRATRSSFRTGALTVSTMVPMRSVPHRVLCLLGLDDGDFPRSTIPDGDDALARRPLTGDRDARSEDRQLLLDALMSAQQHLVITYAGFDEHTGHERPPAVPLGELIDAVERTACGPGVAAFRTKHPLQPFDARNLGVAGSGTPLLPGGRPFSYDPGALDAARSALTGRTPRLRPVEVLLPPLPDSDVDLIDLLRFFESPARAFLRSRLGMLLPEVPELRSEGIPITLDGLAQWAVGDRVLTAVLAGRDLASSLSAERVRGELPPGTLGERILDEVESEVKPLVMKAWEVAGAGARGVPIPREVLDIDLTLPSGRRLTGSLAGLVGDRVLTVTYSQVRAKQRLRSWITSLVLTAAGTAYSSHVVGREKRFRRTIRLHVAHGGHEQDRARELLDQLLDLREQGLRQPIPLPLKTSYAWAQAYIGRRADEHDAQLSAVKEWESNDSYENAFPREQSEPEHDFVYGGIVTLAAILGTPGPDERWEPGVSSRLGQLALRVWRPVLEDGTETMERT